MAEGSRCWAAAKLSESVEVESDGGGGVISLTRTDVIIIGMEIQMDQLATSAY